MSQSSMPEQLSLRVNLRDDATFENFVVGKSQLLLETLNNMFAAESNERLYYLWGGAGVGRSHLCQACCHLANKKQFTAAYLPLAQAEHLSPAMLADLEKMDLVCLDDIDSIAGLDAWEEQIFYLYNRIVSAKTQLVVTANVAPAQLAVRLADLRSRLTACMVFQVHHLTDKEKVQALQLHSKYLGIALPDAVGSFILSHYPRDMYALFALLDKLVKHALQAQKRLSIPMAKMLLEQHR